MTRTEEKTAFLALAVAVITLSRTNATQHDQIETAQAEAKQKAADLGLSDDELATVQQALNLAAAATPPKPAAVADVEAHVDQEPATPVTPPPPEPAPTPEPASGPQTATAPPAVEQLKSAKPDDQAPSPTAAAPTTTTPTSPPSGPATPPPESEPPPPGQPS